MLTRDEAISILKEEAKKTREENPVPVTSSQDNNIQPPAAKKFKSSMFQTLFQSSGPKERTEVVEIDEYLKLEQSDEDECPLKFWKKREARFPTLFKLAISYLTRPASSGAVERLFSVAGAITTARRAKIHTKKLEQMLCYRQVVINKRLTSTQKDEDDESDEDQETDQINNKIVKIIDSSNRSQPPRRESQQEEDADESP